MKRSIIVLQMHLVLHILEFLFCIMPDLCSSYMCWSQHTNYRNTFKHRLSSWHELHHFCVSNPSEVELFAKKNPKQMLRRLEVFLKERRAGGIPRGTSPDPQAQQPSPSLGEQRGARAGTGQGSKGKEMHFTGVCDLPPDMEGEARLI